VGSEQLRARLDLQPCCSGSSSRAGWNERFKIHDRDNATPAARAGRVADHAESDNPDHGSCRELVSWRRAPCSQAALRSLPMGPAHHQHPPIPPSAAPFLCRLVPSPFCQPYRCGPMGDPELIQALWSLKMAIPPRGGRRRQAWQWPWHPINGWAGASRWPKQTTAARPSFCGPLPPTAGPAPPAWSARADCGAAACPLGAPGLAWSGPAPAAGIA